MTRVNKKLLYLTRKIGITILHLHHHRKQLNGDKFTQSSARGATTIIGKVASHLLLDSKPVIIPDSKVGSFKGMRITIEQEKGRQLDHLTPFAVNVHYNPFIKKTIFTNSLKTK